MDNTLISRNVINLGNWHEVRDASGLVFSIANRLNSGSLASTLMMANRPCDWTPEIDGRSAEAKELKAAEADMWKAISRYDKARLAAKALEKRK